MSQETLSHNLMLLCSYYPSIAEVCRRLQINRQQFNKYLSGRTWPSRRNMRRICDFFGVTESELLLGHSRFAEIAGSRRAVTNAPLLSDINIHVEQLYQQSGDLDRYVGYFFRYHYSFGHAARIVKSLAVIYKKHGRYYWKTVERFTWPEGLGKSSSSKYIGVVALLGDRIFVLEYETALRTSITQAILYPSYQTSLTHLIGVQTGMPLLRGRRPAASLVLLEYLGRDVNLKKSLGSCGLYDESSIEPRIRSLIDNHITPESYVLETEEI